MNRYRSLVFSFLSFLAIPFGCLDSVHGQVAISQKRLFSLNPAADKGFGEVVVANSTHVVTGNPKAGPPIPVAFGAVGSISIFNAKSGQRIREISPPQLRNGGEFGKSLALFGNLLAVGEPGGSEVHLYDVVSGRLQRTIEGPDGTRFGAAVAIHGNRLAVGAPEDTGGSGAVFVFDTRTGDQLNSLPIKHPVPEANDNFGSAVAISGDWLMVGAPKDNTSRGIDAGSAFVFELDLFNRVFTFEGSGQAGDPIDANDNLGTSVAINGPVFFAGAPFDETAGQALSGSVIGFFAFDSDVVVLLPTEPTFQGFFGQSLSLADGLLAVGEPGGGRFSGRGGLAHVFSLMNHLAPAEVATLEVQKGESAADGDEFGTSVAVCGNRVYTAAEIDGDGDSAGAVVQFDPLTRKPDAEDFGGLVMRRGDSVPGVPGSVFSGIENHVIDDFGSEVFTLATHAGPGSRGRNKGIYETGATPWVQNGDVNINGVKIVDILSLQVVNDAQFLARRSGTGIGRANNLAVFQFNTSGGIEPVPIFATGEDPGFGVGARVKSFRSIVKTGSGVGVVHGKLVVDRAVTTPGTDSFVAQNKFSNPAFVQPQPVREGGTLGGETLGEILPRLTAQFDQTVIASFLARTPDTNQGVFLVEDNVRVARKGDLAPGGDGGASPVFYQTFLGESGNGSDVVAVRASLRGANVNSGNNEGIWLQISGFPNPVLLARKGAQAAGAPAGVVYHRFLAFRCVQTFSGVNGVVFLAKLRGPGVNPGNDCAVFFAKESALPVPLVSQLLREGDPAPTATKATIGAIQRFVIGPDGSYAALLSLVSRPGEAAPSNNLGLAIGFAGFDESLNDDDSFQRPVMTVRKGWNLDQRGAETIRSLSLFNRIGNATGAQGIGVGEVVLFGSGGTVVSTLEFADRQRVSFRFGFGFED
ncbi:MAG: hypothetical protein KDN20_14260 [Verrucomicrobiae bacterium]|nr:hypothetical protein [Verrucomicrobiae bacterium]